MTREVRTFAEGTLRWVQASGTGGWATASAPVSATVGFVQAGISFNSANNLVTIKDRGVPHHHKDIGNDPIEITFSYLQAVTANLPNPAQASGVSVAAVHMELRHADQELGGVSPTAQYHQFHMGAIISRGWTEGEEGNVFQDTWRFLTMTGPT